MRTFLSHGRTFNVESLSRYNVYCGADLIYSSDSFNRADRAVMSAARASGRMIKLTSVDYLGEHEVHIVSILPGYSGRRFHKVS